MLADVREASARWALPIRNLPRVVPGGGSAGVFTPLWRAENAKNAGDYPRPMHNSVTSARTCQIAMEFMDHLRPERGTVVQNAVHRGRSDKFDPFEPLNGSRANAGRRPGLLRVEGRDPDLGAPLIFRVSDAETDCDGQRSSFLPSLHKRLPGGALGLPDRQCAGLLRLV